MLALLKKYNELDATEAQEHLLNNNRLEYLIGSDWVTYAGYGMCCKVGQGEGKHTMDVSKITSIRIKAQRTVTGVIATNQPVTNQPKWGMFGGRRNG